MISDDTDEKNQTGKLPKRSNETNYMAQMLAGNIFTHLTEEDTDDNFSEGNFSSAADKTKMQNFLNLDESYDETKDIMANVKA